MTSEVIHREFEALHWAAIVCGVPTGGPVRIVGGSWGRRIGTAMVLLRDARDGQVLAVFSRRPEVLDARLTAWLTHVPDTPADLDGADGGSQ